MKSIRIQPWIGLAAVLASTTVHAGQTHYDPASRSYAIKYTYAQLPSADAIMRNNSLMSSVGSSQEASVTPEIDKNVRGFLDDVNKAINSATRGLAMISRLDHVQEIDQADFIIDLTTPSSRGGVAAPLGGAGQAGHFNLYYDTLAREASRPGGRQGVALTAAHELCHYFFGLPDEYLQNGPATALRCPQVSGVGCLMDNYQPGGRGGMYGGWLNRVCNDQEHLITPENGYYMGVTPGSCQSILAAFFRDHQATADFNALKDFPPFSAPTTTGSTGLTTSVDPALIEKAAASTTLQTRFGFFKQLRQGRLTPVDRETLRREARAVLGSILKAAIPSESDLYQASLLVVGALEGVPPRLGVIEGLLQSEYQRIIKAIGQPKTQAAILDIRNKLIMVFRQHPSVGGTAASPADVTIAPNELEYLHSLASGSSTTALTGGLTTPPTPIDGRPPEFQGRIRQRQAVLLTPMPLVHQEVGFPADLAKTQGNPLASYRQISQEGGRFFVSLLKHNDPKARVKLREPFSAASNEAREQRNQQEQASEAQLLQTITAFKAAVDDQGRVKAFAPLLILDDKTLPGRAQVLGDILDGVTRDIESGKLENLILLVPPGGFPDDFDAKLGLLADKVVGKSDVRFDIALVGSVTISHRLRDLSARSGGTVQTITGLDEVGAGLERLVNTQTQGSWICIPESGRIALKANAVVPAPGSAGYLTLYERFNDMRALVHHVSIENQKSSTKRVAFKPFYIDGDRESEMIVGLSQPIQVSDLPGSPAGAFPKPLMTFKTIDAAKARARLDSEDGASQFEVIRQSIEGNDAGFDALPQGQDLTIDTTTSTPSNLVFRMPALADGGLAPGWYVPVLELSPDNFKDRTFVEDAINYTFTASKPKSQIKLLTTLVQTSTETLNANDRGTIRGEKVAVVQAELNFGLPVIKARVTGFVQRIDDNGKTQIRTIKMPLHDDGIAPDLKADDGVYSMTIGLGTNDGNIGAEYRVLVEALSGAESRFITLENLSGEKEDPATALAKPSLPTFQRATSINFRVAPKVPPKD